jgi:hypothetical protein
MGDSVGSQFHSQRMRGGVVVWFIGWFLPFVGGEVEALPLLPSIVV